MHCTLQSLSIKLNIASEQTMLTLKVTTNQNKWILGNYSKAAKSTQQGSLSLLLSTLFDPILFLLEEFSVPLSSLALLVPPLRLMSAVMWEVVRQRNIKHYGKLEEFVSMVTDAVPELMSKREGRLLSLGLRARVSDRKPSSTHHTTIEYNKLVK